MTSVLISAPLGTRARLAESWPNGILVASDGREPSDAALVAARKLSPRSTFGVLSVAPDDATNRDEHDALIDAQLQRLFGESPDVWVETQRGDPPAVIASYAGSHNARLLVTGIGRPRVIERLLGDESTLHLVRLSKTPVFAVGPSCAVPPRRIVAAMDFTSTSIRAAQLAIELAAPDAEIVVAHIWSPTMPAWSETSMRRIVDALQTGFCGRVTSRVIKGHPAIELLALASAWSADAIAIGLHGHAPAERVGIGAVATHVVRCASCSVITVPRDGGGAGLSFSEARPCRPY